MDRRTRLRLIHNKFEEAFGRSGEPIRLVRAPGRVNLIGEHTDYNEGFVLPVAIDREIVIAFRPRPDRLVHIYSYNLSHSHQFSLDKVEREEEESWANYIKGVVYLLQKRGFRLSGIDMVLEGNIPMGASLSSSAAIEVASCLSLQLANEIPLEPLEAIKLCQRAENEFVGVNCGIMDQFISRLAERGKALFLDCRTLEYETVPLPRQGIKIVICNTMAERALTRSHYNKRRRECEEAVSYFKKRRPEIRSLRDVSMEEYGRDKALLPEPAARRCRHVVYENDRVLQSVSSLRKSDWAKFGQLMNESHRSLKEDYQVSSRELDLMVAIAQSTDGVLGARMTGAGFGGCTVNLIEEQMVKKFRTVVERRYREETGIEPEIYVCQAEEGAREISGEGERGK